MFFNQYPYLNLNDFNLDYIIKTLKTLSERLENFIALNTIKYANPIQWNITKQYEANTVVVDPNDGTAYLSVQPVPLGVSLTNTDYWTPIFTLNLISANKNITLRDDGSNVLATFTSNVDDWLIWNGVLYKVTRAIALNEAYVIGYNLTRYTIEMFIDDYVTQLNAIIGDITTLTTTDKSSVVNALNEIVSNVTTNENALNALSLKFSNLKIVNVLDYGAKGDGVTDDTDAINAAAVAAEGNILYFPIGTYIVSDTIHIKNRTKMVGANCDSSIIKRAVGMTGNTIECGYLDSNDGLGAGAVEIKDLRFIRDMGLNYAAVPDTIVLPDTVDESASHIAIYHGQNFIVDNCLIEGMPIGIDVTLSAVGRICNCNIGAGVSTRNISTMTPIYQGQACIRLGHKMDGMASGYTQLISIYNNRFYGATSANTSAKTVGTATETVYRSCGSSYGLLIESCEGLNFYSNYSGANNFANIKISAVEIVMNIKIHDNFFDPSEFYCISLNDNVGTANEIEIVDNIFNGQLIGLMAISADAASVKNYNVHIANNIFDNFLGCMLYLNSIRGLSISNNRIANYNCLNSNSDSFWGSGVTIGSVAEKVYTHDNVFGGGVNTLADSPQCINGVYYAVQNTDNYSVNEYGLSISGTLVINNGQ